VTIALLWSHPYRTTLKHTPTNQTKNHADRLLSESYIKLNGAGGLFFHLLQSLVDEVETVRSLCESRLVQSISRLPALLISPAPEHTRLFVALGVLTILGWRLKTVILSSHIPLGGAYGEIGEANLDTLCSDDVTLRGCLSRQHR